MRRRVPLSWILIFGGVFTATGVVGAGNSCDLGRVVRELHRQTLLLRGKALSSLDEEAYAIFRKERLEPGLKLSREEIQRLGPERYALFKDYQYSHQLVRTVNELRRDLKRGKEVLGHHLRFLRGRGMKDLSPQSRQIFDDFMVRYTGEGEHGPLRDIHDLLSAEEIRLLSVDHAVGLLDDYRNANALIRQVNVAVDAAARKWRRVAGVELGKVDATSLRIFEKVYRNARYVPTQDEIARLRAAGALEAFEDYRASWAVTKKWQRIRMLLERSGRGSVKSENLLVRLLQLDLFLPAALSRRKQAEEIFRKALRSARYSPNEKEREVLRQTRTLEKFEEFQKDLENYRSHYVFLSRVRAARKGVIWTVGLSAAGLQVVGNERVTSEKSLEELKTGQEEGVELIFTEDFDEPIVRIDGKFYRMGWSSLKGGHVSKYGQKDQLVWKKNIQRGGKEGLCFVRKAVAQEAIEKVLQDAESGKVQSHFRVELNLKPDEKKRLRESLERSSGKVYLWLPPVSSGVEQATTVVGESGGPSVPPVVRNSEGMTLAYLKAWRAYESAQVSFGRMKEEERRIGRIRFAAQRGDHARELAGKVEWNFFEDFVILSNAGKILLVAPFLNKVDREQAEKMRSLDEKAETLKECPPFEDETRNQ